MPLSLLLVACHGGERRQTGECPAGETCSDWTPSGLDFIGAQLTNHLLLSGPRATAIGGTQTIALEYDGGYGIDIPLDLPFTADDDGGLGVRVEATNGSKVTVRGVASRSNYLRILDEDGLLMDRKELTGAALSRMELVPANWETIPADTPIAFAPGPREIGVALYGDVQHGSGPRSERIVDTSMELSLAGAERIAWDVVRVDAVLGTHALAVTAGDKPTNTLDVVVVDTADTIAPIGTPPVAIAPNQSESVCFAATNAGHYIVGLTWTFEIDGEPQVHGDGALNRNCVSVHTTKTSGTVSLAASAGGQSMMLDLTIGSARERADLVPAVRPLAPAIPTAGDRAAM